MAATTLLARRVVAAPRCLRRPARFLEDVAAAELDLARAALPRRALALLDAGGGSTAWSTRATTSAALECVLNAGEDGRVALVGADGTGKSVGLVQVLLGCRAAEWVVAHVPRASLWSHDRQSINASTRSKGRVDQYDAAAGWLRYFMSWNDALLARINVSTEYDWGGALSRWRTTGEHPQTLHDLAQLGMDDPTVAADVVGVMLKELRAGSTPTVVAVDEYNAWLRPVYPDFVDFKNKAVTPDRAALIRHFLKITDAERAGTGGTGVNAVVVAESGCGRNISREALPGYHAFEYTDYTDEEFDAFGDAMTERRFITKRLTDKERGLLKYVVSMNPRELRRSISGM